jgi:alkanesulfonate monooxygenase SsuD/methylene tetrahydromethanopterin reductase-like flavin-dependent oxidoreductase (luciferase family)
VLRPLRPGLARTTPGGTYSGSTAGCARSAESVGWDGLFLWDRIAYPLRERAVADPWVALSAIASVTEILRLGPMITPLSRRRVQKVAGETVTLDHLSNGRLTLGVGLTGGDVHVWEAAGATWALTSIEPQPLELEIREVIEAGP